MTRTARRLAGLTSDAPRCSRRSDRQLERRSRGRSGAARSTFSCARLLRRLGSLGGQFSLYPIARRVRKTQAASYSWISPPRRSPRRRARVVSSAVGSRPSGAMRCRVRCVWGAETPFSPANLPVQLAGPSLCTPQARARHRSCRPELRTESCLRSWMPLLAALAEERISAVARGDFRVSGGVLVSALLRRRIEGRSGPESSIKRLHTRYTLELVQVEPSAKMALCRHFAEPSDGLEPSTPSLPFDARGNQLQRTATDLACFSGFAAGAICRCLPLVAPAGLHKRSIPVAGISDEKGDSGIALLPARGMTRSL